jgi:hypothetical protein
MGYLQLYCCDVGTDLITMVSLPRSASWRSAWQDCCSTRFDRSCLSTFIWEISDWFLVGPHYGDSYLEKLTLGATQNEDPSAHME